VAGIWTFSFQHYQQISSLGLSIDKPDKPGGLRMHLVYLDDEPLETTARLLEVRSQLEESSTGEPKGDSELLLSTPVKTIIPWQDW
jgi:hypothetical protein